MTPYRWWRDPLFIASCALYALNRWVLKPRVHSAFLHDHFNDVLMIPCALPPFLWLLRQLRLREHDDAPTPGEIVLYLGFWSLWFEGIGPRFIRGTTGDPWDVAAYGVGAAGAALWWHRGRLVRRRAAP